jgi:hypothetical protein
MAPIAFDGFLPPDSSGEELAHQNISSGERVRAVGGRIKKACDRVKEKVALGLIGCSGVFDFQGERNWFIGGDLQEAAAALQNSTAGMAG